MTQLLDSMSACRLEDGLQALAQTLHQARELGAGKASGVGVVMEYTTMLQGCHTRGEVEAILLKVCRAAREEVKRLQPASARELMEQALACIEHEYGNHDLSLQWMSDRLGVSASYFSRLFNARAGMSFPDYVNEVRLRKARELLLKGELDIRAIGERTGFNSSSYFSTAFRRKYGLSPSAFRRRRGGEA